MDAMCILCCHRSLYGGRPSRYREGGSGSVEVATPTYFMCRELVACCFVNYNNRQGLQDIRVLFNDRVMVQ